MTLVRESAPQQNHDISLSVLQAGAVWLMFAVSFFVKIEPAPVDLMFVVVFVLCIASGLRFSPAIVPLIIFLLIYNLGGLASYYSIAPDSKARMFIITSFYMAIMAIFFALYIAEAPQRHLAIIKNGWVFAATVAAVLGIIGASGIGGAISSYFSLYGRATAGFKDPNVFATYLIPPAAMLIHGLLTGKQRYAPLALAALLLIVAGLFLGFSRGAWINLAGVTMLMTILTFVLSSTLVLRTRIIIMSLAGLIALGVLFAIILSIPEFRNLFLDRFTLVKSYDAGETGRFGNQLNSIPMLLERPLGFGPMQFATIFKQDPHNTYLNAFASYGWLGGIAFLLVAISTFIVGFRTILMRTPWQDWSIAVFCALFTTMLQAVQIDIDHWRHFYWMLGIVWGLYAASWNYLRENNRETV